MDLDGDDGEALMILEMMRMQIVRIMMLVLLLINSGVLNERRAIGRDCIDLLRLGRAPFRKLCAILEERGGLSSTRGVSIHEQVAMFLSIIGHYSKNRVIKKSFFRSGHTVSIRFNRVLNAVMRCHDIFLVTPEPVTADCDDERWKWFKGCLGALDGTYVPVRVPATEQARYRSRKSICSVNVLGVCDRNMNFVYVLSGWEGSAADGRVLRDATHRPNGFRVPKGNYYLCDAGYTNGEGFLAPYHGIRYHINEWDIGPNRPRNAREVFNNKHAKARNVIERCFGILKERWAILRSMSFYPIETQNKIILACCLLYNFIRLEMDVDPIEALVPEVTQNDCDDNTNIIEHVQTSPQWTAVRDEMAESMFNQ